MTDDTPEPDTDGAEALLAAIDTVVFRVDRECRWVSLNPAWQRLTGWEVAATLGTPCLDAVAPADRQQVREALAALVAGERDHCRVEARLRASGGAERCVDVSGRRLIDARGGFAGVAGTIADASERQQAQQELRLFMRAFEDLDEAILVTDADGHITHLNPAAEALFGRPFAAAIGQPAASVGAPESAAELEALIGELLEHGRWAGEFTFVRPDGTRGISDVTLSTLRDAAGHVTGYVGVNRDVTARRAAEQRLVEAERRYRTLVERLPAATYMTDPDGTTIYVSPQLAAMVGIPAVDFPSPLGSWLVKIDERDRAAVTTVVESSLVAGESFDIQYRVTRPDGRVVWLRDLAAPVHDEDGTLCYWLGVVFDVTSERRTGALLHATEVEYRSLVEHLPLVIYRAAGGDLLHLSYNSPQIEAFTGVPAATLVAHPATWQGLIDPADYARARDDFARSTATSEPLRTEYWVRARDGERRCLRDEAVLVRDTTGAPYWQGIIQDITERARTEERLRLLIETSAVLASTLELEPMLADVAHLLTRELADVCAIDLLTARGATRATIACRDPELHARAVAIAREEPLSALPPDHPAVQGVRRSWPVLAEPFPRERQAEMAHGPNHRAFLDQLDLVSGVSAPLTVRGRLIGRLSLARGPQLPRYAQEDLTLAVGVAGRIALAIDNARHFEREQRERERAMRDAALIRRLHALTPSRLSEYADEALLSALLEGIRELVEADGAAICLLDPETRTVSRCVATGDYAGDEALLDALFPAEAISWLAAVRDALLLSTTGQTAEVSARLAALGIHSTFGVPISLEGRLLGIVQLGARAEGWFSPERIRLLQLVTDRLAVTIENARLYQRLAERERQLQDTVERLLLAQEAERRRVAREVHDELTQLATGVHQLLQVHAARLAPDDPDAPALAAITDLAGRTVRESRRVIANLRPTILDDFGLAAAIRWLVAELREDGWQVEYADTLGDERLPAAWETALYRVAQEAIANLRRHAGGGRAAVTLARAPDTLTLKVRDWGRGFDPAAAASRGSGPGERVGLVSMRERVSLLGGTLRIESAPGEGTRVIAVVPVPPGASLSPPGGYERAS